MIPSSLYKCPWPTVGYVHDFEPSLEVMLGHLISSIVDNLGIFRLIKRYISAPFISASEFHHRQLLLDGAWEAYPALEGGAAGMDGGTAQGATN